MKTYVVRMMTADEMELLTTQMQQSIFKQKLQISVSVRHVKNSPYNMLKCQSSQFTFYV